MAEPEQHEAMRIEHLQGGEYLVVHPLDDTAEDKVAIERLGPMKMTPRVRWALGALRWYLAGMAALVVYRCLQLAGFAG